MARNVLLLALLCILTISSSADLDLNCSPSVCQEWLSENTCPELDEACLKNGRIFTYPIECGCCEYCIDYLEAGDYCDIGQLGQPTAGTICGAGLSCTKGENDDFGTCQRIDSDCHRAQDLYDLDDAEGDLGHLRQRPICDDYGLYGPVVCIPGSICYCTDPYGARIFGEVVFDSPDLPLTMKCACSRAAWRASRLKLGNDAVFSHCLTNGSYDPLQCVDNACTCIDEEGIPNNQLVHVADLNDTSLSCFSKELGHVKGTWARPCEAERANSLARQRDAVRSGATAVLNDLPNCGLDGRYERLQPRGENFVCTDPEGIMIDTFTASRYSPFGINMNCNCARTKHTLQKAAEATGILPMLPDCCSNGNYESWQCSRGVCYCVDSNGNQLYYEVSEEDVAELMCYKQLNGDPCFVDGTF